MKCPECGSTALEVKDSRPSTVKKISCVRRRRLCVNCSHKWTTLELPHEIVSGVILDIGPLSELVGSLAKAVGSVQTKIEQLHSIGEGIKNDSVHH